MSKYNGWIDTTLGQVIEIYDHKRIPLNSRARAKRQGQYPYYGASGIVDYIDDYIFDGRYLLIAEDGENLNSRKTPVAFFANGKFWVNNHAHIVRGINGVADDYFLMSYLENSNISGYITGAAQPKLSQANLKSIKLTLPPYPVQRKIVDVLSAYDDLIEVNTRRIRILEQMAQSLYREWFGKVDGKSLPEQWNTVTIGDFGDVITGKTPSKAVEEYWNSRDVPFIRTPDMHDQLYCIETTDYVSTGGANSQRNAFIPANSLCVSCIGTVGIVTITAVKAQTNQQINSVVLNDLSDLEFLYFELLGLKETLQSYAATGATMANLSKGKFMALKVLSPPKELREKFHVVASAMFEQIKNLQYKNTNLRRTRDLLLPRLVGGEIELGLDNE